MTETNSKTIPTEPQCDCAGAQAANSSSQPANWAQAANLSSQPANSSTIRTVIFDFDGTLHDSAYIYMKAFLEAYEWLVAEGHAQPRTFQLQDISCYLGLTADEMWSSFAPELPKSVTDQAARIVGAAMDRFMTDGSARLFPGVPEMLTRVHDAGLNCVFLSNCRIAYKDVAREVFGLDQWFSAYYSAEAFGDIPKEEIFKTIAKEQPGSWMAVGDRYKDLNLARAHDLPSVGCLYGYGSYEELQDATALASSVPEVADCVLRICGLEG